MLSSFTKIITTRLLLRPLVVSDVNETYAGWLSDPATNQYIITKLNLADLKDYVVRYNSRTDVLFLGIFEKKTGIHIGNIKYEPVNFEFRYAIMGLLIGDSTWRGKGVAKEVLESSAEWLNKNCEIKQIVLGVNNCNKTAISAYKKIGFVIKETAFVKIDDTDSCSMVWDI